MSKIGFVLDDCNNCKFFEQNECVKYINPKKECAAFMSKEILVSFFVKLSIAFVIYIFLIKINNL
jgi:hypothetical protein